MPAVAFVERRQEVLARRPGRHHERRRTHTVQRRGNDTFTVKVCFTETPYVVTWRFVFSGDEVRVESEANVSFGATKDAPLVGKAG